MRRNENVFQSTLFRLGWDGGSWPRGRFGMYLVPWIQPQSSCPGTRTSVRTAKKNHRTCCINSLTQDSRGGGVYVHSTPRKLAQTPCTGTDIGDHMNGNKFYFLCYEKGCPVLNTSMLTVALKVFQIWHLHPAIKLHCTIGYQ